MQDLARTVLDAFADLDFHQHILLLKKICDVFDRNIGAGEADHLLRHRAPNLAVMQARTDVSDTVSGCNISAF